MGVASLVIQIAVFTLLGVWLDSLFGSMIVTPIALTIAMVGAAYTLIRMAQKWTPIAKRSEKALSDAPSQDDELDR